MRWSGALTPAAVITALGMIATGWAVFKTQSNKFLRQANADLRDSLHDKDGEIADLEKKVAERDATVAERDKQLVEKDRDIEAVSRVVTGEVHWQAIETLIHDVISRLKVLTDKIDQLLRKKP